jgi:dTDP-4-dehydrorhamnose 3,5-epimerase
MSDRHGGRPVIFTETAIAGVYVVELEPRRDDRGFFARAFCADEFAAHGLETHWVQANVGHSERAGTIRGLHYQVPPHAEAKLVRCTAGAVFDVAVDLREGSPTYLQWYGTELSAGNGRMLYLPKGVAHGYQSLTDDAEAYYLVTAAYAPAAERGLRWDDPDLDIAWPLFDAPILSDKDAGWPLLASTR